MYWTSPAVWSTAILWHFLFQTHQNFHSSEAIVPRLPVAVQCTLAEDLNVLPTPDPKGDRLLEGVVKVILLPVFNVVGELSLLSAQAQVGDVGLSLNVAPSIHHLVAPQCYPKS